MQYRSKKKTCVLGHKIFQNSLVAACIQPKRRVSAGGLVLQYEIYLQDRSVSAARSNAIVDHDHRRCITAAATDLLPIGPLYDAPHRAPHIWPAAVLHLHHPCGHP